MPKSIDVTDEVHLWEEQGAVHLKAVTKEGDPTELAAHEVQSLIDALTKLLKEINA